MGSSGGSRGTSPGLYQPGGYGFVAWTTDPADAGTDYTLASGLLALVRVFVPAGNVIAAVWAGVKTAGNTAGGETRAAVYDDTGARIGISADTATWMTTSGWRSLALGASIAAAGADRYVWVASLTTYGSTPTVKGNAAAVDVLLNRGTANRRSVFLTSQTTAPASVDLTAATLNTAIYSFALS